MKSAFTWLALIVCLAGASMSYGRAQGRGNPFLDRSDTGAIVHVLPLPASIRAVRETQPTDAPVAQGTALYPASYGSGNVLDHGGKEMSNAGFWAVYWNTEVSSSAQTSLGYATLKEQINAFIESFSDKANWDDSTTDDYTIVQQYGSTSSIASSLTNMGFLLDSQPLTKTITDSKIQAYLAGLFNAGRLQPMENVVYGIYFPPGMRITLRGGGSCSSFCGYHSHFSYGNLQIKYASFPYLNCNGCSLSGKTVADMLTIVTSHEIREAVTDPGDFGVDAWYDAAGYEADDKCAWHNLYQMTSGGFWVQPEYSNGGTVTRSGFTATYPGPGCVVPNNPAPANSRRVGAR
jgi:hypothetical protein